MAKQIEMRTSFEDKSYANTKSRNYQTEKLTNDPQQKRSLFNRPDEPSESVRRWRGVVLSGGLPYSIIELIGSSLVGHKVQGRRLW